MKWACKPFVMQKKGVCFCMNLYLVLVLLYSLELLFLEYASPKTRRYFVNVLYRAVDGGVPVEARNLADPDLYPARMLDLVRTFVAVLAKRSRSASLIVDGDSYPVADYEFPDRWWDLAKARFVYSSVSASSRCDPMFRVNAIDGRLLAPHQVHDFFRDYNSNEAEADRISVSLCPATFNDVATISDFSALCDLESNSMVYWSGAAGTISDYVAQVLQIACPVSDVNLLSMYDMATERAVAKWLISKE